MKKNEIIKILMPGVIVGLILGFGLTMLVGVNKENVIPNYIGGIMCCFLPTILNCIVVLKQTASQLKRKISIGNVLKRSLPKALIAGLIGFIVVAGLVNKLLNIDICNLSVIITAIYEAILGVIISTIMAYIALKKYISDVKYTKRNK